MKHGKSYFWLGMFFAIGALLSARGLRHRRDDSDTEEAPASHERPADPNIIPAIERSQGGSPTQIVTAAIGQDAQSFSALVEKSWEALPKMEILKGRTDAQVHNAPPELIKSAESLGQIVTRMRANPQVIPQGVEFLRACAEREELIDTVRVLCYRDLKFWSVRANPPITATVSDFPKDLERRASLLPSLR